MFTGLVAATGALSAIERAGDEDGAVARIESSLAGELGAGDSVAVDGVCLTARQLHAGGFSADLSPETLTRSALGARSEGDRVNLELAVRAGDRLGGHIVQGHVDGVGTVEDLAGEGPSRRMRVACAPELLRYVVEKGSIAVDGVSLTAVAVDAQGFSAALVPETLERTTLGDAAAGRAVNLEVDIVAKYVEKLTAA